MMKIMLSKPNPQQNRNFLNKDNVRRNSTVSMQPGEFDRYNLRKKNEMYSNSLNPQSTIR